MRIIRTSQEAPPSGPASRVPVSVGDKEVHPQARRIMEELDARHHLTVGEMEWALGGLEEDYGYLSNSDTLPQPERTLDMLDKTFQWARETRKNLLGIEFGAAVGNARLHAIDKQLLGAFGNQPWVMQLAGGKSAEFKMALMRLNQQIPGGMTFEEAAWIFRKGGLSSHTGILDSSMATYANVLKWSRATGTRLSTMNDFGTAQSIAAEWSDYQRKSDLARRLSKRSLRTVRLSGKWKAVWIDPDAMARDEEGGESQPGAEHDSDREIEQQITRIRLDTTDRAISIRDPNGVPQATIEISGDPSNGWVDVYDMETTTDAKPHVKELVGKLKAEGVKLRWAGDSIRLDSIRAIKEEAYDPYGIVPSLSIAGEGEISDADSYKKALDLAYDEGWGGSWWYEGQSASILDALADYAEQRGELHEMEDAKEQFAEFAMSSWDDAKHELANAGTIPPEPREDDAKYNRGGKFNSKKYNADLDAWYKETEEYEREHEPNKFENMAHKAIESRKEKPENKPYYDEIERREREEAERRRKAKEEEDISNSANEMRGISRRMTEEITEGDYEFGGDDDRWIVASVTGSIPSIPMKDSSRTFLK